MSVCIAALYNRGEGVVLAVDKLVRFGEENDLDVFRIEHEDAKKLTKLNSTTCILASGNCTYAHTIVDTVKAKVREGQSLSSILSLVRREYRKQRKEAAFVKILSHHFVDWEDYYKKIRVSDDMRKVSEVLSFEHKIGNFRFDDVGIIVAGKGSQKYEIYTSDGKSIVPSTFDFAVEGSGFIYAKPILVKKLTEAHTKEEVAEVVKEAKKAAEQDEDVGSATIVKFLS